MIEFFKTIGEAITALFQTIKYVFSSIPFLIDSVKSALDIGVLFVSLPTFIGGLATITLVVAIVFLILRIFHG